MNIVKATARYEDWLEKRLTVIPADVSWKHSQMAAGVFPFLRATYYRWAQTWEKVCGPVARAPSALAVGDLHVENFGTWRDIEGRLIWGINDFDEVFPLPYTNDLVRLATSAFFSIEGGEAFVCDTLLAGYAAALEAGGCPFVLAERHPHLREMASARLHQPEKFWDKLHSQPDLAGKVPAGAIKALAALMPEGGIDWRIVHRIAGLGSLGRQRFVALANWRGGSLAREAKALAPSACVWAERGKGTDRIRYREMLDSAVRCRDPFVSVRARWIVRRLAPDCSRIELSSLPREREAARLLHDMGWETANIHLGSLKSRTLLADQKKRPRGWLKQAATAMRKAVVADWGDWKAHGTGVPEAKPAADDSIDSRRRWPGKRTDSGGRPVKV